MAEDGRDRPRAAILSMMKDEGHSLLEWVAFHRHIGFDRISVYTNNCSDGTDDMLIRLEEMGLDRHFRNDVPAGKKPQPHALSLATRNPVVTNADWLLVMDADEFVSVKLKRGRITDLIDALPEGTDAIALTWRFFGSNGLTDWNPGFVTESYTRAAPDKFRKGWGVKTLFRPYEGMRLGIHRPHIKSLKTDPEAARILRDQAWVNGSGKPMPKEFNLSGWRSTKPTLGYKWAELNHYGVKSHEAYLLRRLRGNVNNKEDKYNAAYFSVFDRNEIEAPNVLRHLRGTKKIVARLLEDPALRALQERALDFHRERVERLRATPDYEAWLAELKQAAEMPIERLNEVLFIQHLPREMQEEVKRMQAAGIPDREIALAIDAAIQNRKATRRAELMAQADKADAADAAEEEEDLPDSGAPDDDEETDTAPSATITPFPLKEAQS